MVIYSSADAMASGSTCHNSNHDSKISCCSSPKLHFRKTVCLKDWWLERPENNFEGSPLAVAGITSREKQAVRVFSAPISKRCDVFTLETVDGVFIILQGLMNKARTEANGFPSEVCKHFVFGFPPYWEMCARKCSIGESPFLNAVKRSQDFERLSPLSRNIGDSREKSPQKGNYPSRTYAAENLEEHYKYSSLSPCRLTKKGELNLTVRAIEDLSKSESIKKSLTENYLSQAGDMEFESPTEICRELAHTFSNFIMSKEEKIMSKSDSVGRYSETGNAHAISCKKSVDQSVLKHTENHGSAKGITPRNCDARGHLSSTKQKEKLPGSIKQSISQSANLRAEKPGEKLANGSSVSEKQKDECSDVSPLSLSFKRSRSGRLLLPRLEYWRNQRVIYDAGRKITEVKDLDLNALSGGSIS